MHSKPENKFSHLLNDIEMEFDLAHDVFRDDQIVPTHSAPTTDPGLAASRLDTGVVSCIDDGAGDMLHGAVAAVRARSKLLQERVREYYRSRPAFAGETPPAPRSTARDTADAAIDVEIIETHNDSSTA